ncbi:oxidoreductase [soil metagenome]
MATWFITGASRGLGLALALHVLEIGDRVIATARDLERLESAYSAVPADRVLPLALDITDERAARETVETAVARFGRIDYLVNNAGRGLVGAVEEAAAAEVDAVFATNVFGLLNVTRAVLPGMRAERHGTIVNVSSMGGFAQVAGWGVYGATKFAVEGLSEAMRAELEPLGIAVMIVEPGSFRTDFLDSSSLQRTDSEITDYSATAGRVRHAAADANGAQINDPTKGAAAIVTAATSPNPPSRLQLGPDAIAMVEGKLDHVRAELESWRAVSTSTLFS